MDSSAKSLLIVYHSQSGRNERLAFAAQRAARLEAGVDVRLRRAAEAGTRDLQWADGVLFMMPENFGALAGGMKEFFDRIFYPVIDSNIQCSYALCCCTGNDGTMALRQLQRILAGLPFREVSAPLIVHGEPDEVAEEKAAELGQALAAGIAMGIY